DFHVTGVQTCALPIYAFRLRDARLPGPVPRQGADPGDAEGAVAAVAFASSDGQDRALAIFRAVPGTFARALRLRRAGGPTKRCRSEERRVGKQGRRLR